jgi:tetratricopeptide (TPR) repeat protein
LKYCSECGYHLDKGTEKYCPECGYKFEQKVVADVEHGGTTNISDTKGNVIGAGFRGDENVFGKELGGYTREGNIIHLHVNTISSEILEKIINSPTQVNLSPVYKGLNKDNKDVKKAQAAMEINKQTRQFLDQINKIEEKEGTQIIEIKAGDLQVSRDELSLKEIILKGNEHLYKQEYNEAIEYYDKALKIEYNNFDLWFNKGYSLNRLGKHEEAIECYDKAIKINPNDADAWTNKSAALNSLGKYQEAIESCDKAIKINPNDALAWSNKGSALVKLGKYNEAIECYDKALKIDPNYTLAQEDKTIVLNLLNEQKKEKKKRWFR